MTFSDYGTIAELFSAFAIIITLIYGIAQLRINNRLARVELTTQMGQGLHDFYIELGKNTETARVWREGLLGRDTLTADEATQFTLLCTGAFLGFEMQFRLQHESLLTSQMFERGDKQVQYMMSQPGVRKWWPKNRLNFNADFVEHLDKYFEASESSEMLKAAQI